MTATVVTTGELVIDWLAEKPGQDLLNPGTFYRQAGGNAVNVAVGLSRLGGSARLLGKIGHDPDGLYIKELLLREGVDVSRVIVDGRYHTAQCYCLTRGDGEHEYYNWPGQNAAQMLEPHEIDKQDLEQAGILHATGISLAAEPRAAAVSKAIEMALDCRMTVSYDAVFPTGAGKSRAAEKALASAHILKMNYPELLFWSGANKPEPVDVLAHRIFSTYRPLLLAVTLGSEGSYLLTGRQEVKCEPTPVKSLCGIGAGDAFVAGLLHFLLSSSSFTPDKLAQLPGGTLLDAGLFANTVGALATRCRGALDGLPKASEMKVKSRS